MGNTYTQIHLQLIFAVQFRAFVIQPDWEIELHKYITSIISENTHKPIIINGMEDHIHICLGMRPVQSLSELMKEIKANSSEWINRNKYQKGKFRWQEGFAAFSYSKRDVSSVIEYIKNQKEHHKTTRFSEEYRKFLDENDIVFDERYLLTDPV